MFDKLFKPDVEKLKQKRDVNALIKALESKDNTVRMAAVNALSELRFDPSLKRVAIVPLLKLVEDNDDFLRRKAVEILCMVKNPQVLEPLIKALKDKEGMVRKAAADALGYLRHARTVEPLIKALSDEEDFVRAGAAKALAQFCDARTVEPFIQALGDTSMMFYAARALGKLGDARAVEPLISKLKDEGELLRMDVVASLGQMKLHQVPNFRPLIAKLELREEVVTSLGQLGDIRAVEPLIAMLKDEGLVAPLFQESGDSGYCWEVKKADASLRRKVLASLGQLGDARALETLIKALGDSDRDMRAAAAEALGQLGDALAVEPLIQVLISEDKHARPSAARALGQLGDARAVEPLIKALEDSEWDLRVATAEALGQLGDKRALSPLIGTLENWNNEAGRFASAMALHQLGDPHAVKPLIEALQARLWQVRKSAIVALEQIAKTNPKRILAQWSLIKSKAIEIHEDTRVETTSDCAGHIDKGIGVPFPDKPKKLDF